MSYILLNPNLVIQELYEDVSSTGPGKYQGDGSRRQMAVAVGNTVLFGKYAGTEINRDGAISTRPSRRLSMNCGHSAVM